MAADLETQYDQIYRYCYFHLHERELSEDITQEAFLRYFSSGSRLDSVSALKYLYTIARNLCIDEYRKAGKQKERERREAASDEWACTGSEEERTLTNLAVRKALSEMNEEEQELLLLRYVNEVPPAVIGRLYGISRFAVYRKLRLAAEKFKDKLRKEGFDET